MLINEIIDQIIIPISISVLAGVLLYFFSITKYELKAKIKNCVLALIVFGLFVLSMKYFSQPEISPVPRMIGESIDEAKIILSKNGFKIEMKENWNPNYDVGIIYEQKPNPGIMLMEGRTITLFVSKGSQLSLTPSVLKLHKDEAIERIRAVSLNVETKYVPSKEIQKEMVVGQNPDPNTRISIGSKVILSISSGNKTTIIEKDSIVNRETTIVGMPYLIYSISDNNWTESYQEPVELPQQPCPKWLRLIRGV